jgi:cytochrome c oxidase subunit 1
MSPFTGEYFSLVTLTITVPMTIFGVNMLASLWGAKLELNSPMLFALGVLALFGSGGFGGLFLGNATADMQLHDTYFVVGHFHMMIGGVTLMATFGGLYYWFPKMFGKMMNETLGKAHFWLTFGPFFLIFFMQHFLGIQGAPRRYYAYSASDFLKGTHWQNVTMSLSAMLLISGQALFVINFVLSLLFGKKATENPWGATTLEWTTASPPPHGNFGAHMPTVHRWAYEYGVETKGGDFATQDVPANQVPVTA